MAVSGVNVKMGVTGVAQFKQNINQAKQSVKTLDAQLELSEKQFKASGDAESYMTEKSELLKAKLEAQKSVVASAEEALKKMADQGIDKSSKAYQDMYRQMLQAKGEIIDTENAMNGVATAGDDAAKGVEEMNDQIKKVGKGVSFQNVSDGISKITDSMAAAAKKAIQLGKTLLQSSMDSAGWADDIMTRASKFGVSPEVVQAMDNAAAYIDTDVSSILSAQQRLRKAMGSDNAETMGVFAALGIDPTNMSWEDAFWKAGEALQSLGDDIDKESYAQKLFGKSWQDLNPLFEAGRRKYEETLSEQTVLTQKQVEALAKQDDAMKKMDQQIKLLKDQFWSGLAPAITETTNALSGLLEQFNKYLSTEEGQEMLDKLGSTFSTLLDDLTNIDPNDIMSGLKGAMESLQTAMEWIQTNGDSIVNAIKGIGIAFGTLKAGELAINLARVISGLKELLHIGGDSSAASDAGTSIGGSGFFAKAFSGVKTLAASGLGLTGSIIAASIIPPLFANAADDRRVEAQLNKRLASASMMAPGVDRDFLERASKALGIDWHGGNEADIDSILMGMNNRSDLQKAQLQVLLNGHTANGSSTWSELQRLWNGEPMDMGQENAILQSVTDAYTRMAEQSAIQQKSSEDLSKAAEILEGMPEQVESAILNGMSKVNIYIDGEKAGKVITPYVDGAVGSAIASFFG